MRAYAYCYSNTDSEKPFERIYEELKRTASEDARYTISMPWINGITYSDIYTVAAIIKGNTDIIITGDSSGNKTQVMPGGIAVSREVKLSENWNGLTSSMNYNPIESFYLSERDNAIAPPRL